MKKRKQPKRHVTAELIQSSAAALRRTHIGVARAGALAGDVERLNDAAIAAAGDSDFNDEPARFAVALAQLKAPAR